MTLQNVTRLRVPRRCLTAVEDHLLSVGRQGLEGFALWVGRHVGDEFRVTQTYIPEQTGHRLKEGVCVTVSGPALHKLNVWLYENQLTLAAQLHSHPSDAYHSETDDTYPIATQLGAFSIVLPDFARRGLALDSAWYRLRALGVWTPIQPPEVRRLFILED